MPARSGYIPSLDGLRAFSILIVMAGHFISGKIFPGGFGVTVFFVISGFLITRNCFAETTATGTLSIVNFYMRRIIRLYPVIVVFCILTFAAAKALGISFSAQEFLSVPFYYANYWFQYHRPGDQDTNLPIGVFWSLAIEEHFYIVFPLLLVALRFRAERLVAAMLAAMVAALVLRVSVAHLYPDLIWTEFFYRRSEMRMDSIAVGVLIAALCQIREGRAFLLRLCHPVPLLAAMAGLAVCFAIRDQYFREVLRYSLLNVCIATALVPVLFWDRLRVAQWVLNRPTAIWIGRLSYSLYVWHEFVAGFLIRPHGALGITGAFLGSFLVATLSFTLVERPFNGLRRRFGHHRSKLATRDAVTAS